MTTTITNENQLPRNCPLFIPLPNETDEAAAARVARQTGKPVTVYRLGNLTFIATEEGV